MGPANGSSASNPSPTPWAESAARTSAGSAQSSSSAVLRVSVRGLPRTCKSSDTRSIFTRSTARSCSSSWYPVPVAWLRELTRIGCTDTTTPSGSAPMGPVLVYSTRISSTTWTSREGKRSRWRGSWRRATAPKAVRLCASSCCRASANCADRIRRCHCSSFALQQGTKRRGRARASCLATMSLRRGTPRNVACPASRLGSTYRNSPGRSLAATAGTSMTTRRVHGCRTPAQSGTWTSCGSGMTASLGTSGFRASSAASSVESRATQPRTAPHRAAGSGTPALGPGCSTASSWVRVGEAGTDNSWARFGNGPGIMGITGSIAWLVTSSVW
mmetsp:Transcript_124954/g.216616  ORF Transcript_124954/g.216616 Transcript_124954/m.216616 type:complete len:330 (+) Transcript_124954:249-1238(+)